MHLGEYISSFHPSPKTTLGTISKGRETQAPTVVCFRFVTGPLSAALGAQRPYLYGNPIRGPHGSRAILTHLVPDLFLWIGPPNISFLGVKARTVVFSPIVTPRGAPNLPCQHVKWP